MYSWQRIHRTRRGAYTPATACPAGANTLVTVVSGALEVLVYAPADGLPCLRPTFGNAPCSPPPSSSWDGASNSGVKNNNQKQEDKESRSDIDDDKTQSSLLGGVNTAEGREGEISTSPKPNPRVLLEEALGLEGRGMDDEDQSLPHKSLAFRKGDEDKDNTKATDGKAKEEEEFQAAGDTDNTSNDDGGRSPYSSESLNWPHEPRYCADVWQKYDSQDDGTVARFVEIPSHILFACLDAQWYSQGWYHG